MAVNVSTRLQSLALNLDMRFQQAMTQAPSFYQRVATETRSNTFANLYPLFDRMPGQLRKWVGERVKQSGTMFEYLLKNEKYEGTVSIRREDVEDNQVDLYGYLVDGIGYETRVWPDKLITSILEAGTTNTTFDGQPFFSAAHPLDASVAGGAVQSNLFNTANGGTRPLTAPNLGYVTTAVRSLKGADNNPLGIGARISLMVPPALEWTARTILNTGMIAPTAASAGNAANIAVTNVYQGAADLIVNPWLTSATAWYVMATDVPIKPFIFQRRTDPEFTALTANDDENVFLHDEYIYGVRVRGNAGYGLWFSAAKADSA